MPLNMSKQDAPSPLVARVVAAVEAALYQDTEASER